MNSRERFLEVMNFNTNVRSMKWEFGFWGENITQWYQEGLPKKYGTNIPTNLTTVAASLKYGGYVPTGDHCISPGVSWENFKYYRRRLNEIIDANGAV